MHTRSSRWWVVSAVLMLPFAPSAAEPGQTKPSSITKPPKVEVGDLLRKQFASIDEVYAWTTNYTRCCGCSAPVVLKRGTKEAVVVFCMRTSGMLTNETFVFDKHETHYRFMLLRNLLYQNLTVSEEGDDIVLAGSSPVLRIPWSGIGVE